LYIYLNGEAQKGAPPNLIKNPLVIGWGRSDHVCLQRQARRAIELFPDTRLHWFDHSGHFLMWNVPQATTRLIIEATSGTDAAKTYGAGAA